jgi:hypothetical protein
MQELLIAYVKSEDNLADVMTKVLPNGSKRDNPFNSRNAVGYNVIGLKVSDGILRDKEQSL